jgi:hypothetical protein
MGYQREEEYNGGYNEGYHEKHFTGYSGSREYDSLLRVQGELGARRRRKGVRFALDRDRAALEAERRLDEEEKIKEELYQDHLDDLELERLRELSDKSREEVREAEETLRLLRENERLRDRQELMDMLCGCTIL